MVDSQGGLFNSRNDTVHGGGSLEPVAPGSALTRRHGVRTCGQPRGYVSGLVPFPILSTEPLGKSLREGEMTSDPGDRDPRNHKGPKVGVGTMK